jgi:hypothetical protein
LPASHPPPPLPPLLLPAPLLELAPLLEPVPLLPLLLPAPLLLVVASASWLPASLVPPLLVAAPLLVPLLPVLAPLLLLPLVPLDPFPPLAPTAPSAVASAPPSSSPTLSNPQMLAHAACPRNRRLTRLTGQAVLRRALTTHLASSSRRSGHRAKARWRPRLPSGP